MVILYLILEVESRDQELSSDLSLGGIRHHYF